MSKSRPKSSIGSPWLANYLLSTDPSNELFCTDAQLVVIQRAGSASSTETDGSLIHLVTDKEYFVEAKFSQHAMNRIWEEDSQLFLTDVIVRLTKYNHQYILGSDQVPRVLLCVMDCRPEGQRLDSWSKSDPALPPSDCDMIPQLREKLEDFRKRGERDVSCGTDNDESALHALVYCLRQKEPALNSQSYCSSFNQLNRPTFSPSNKLQSTKYGILHSGLDCDEDGEGMGNGVGEEEDCGRLDRHPLSQIATFFDISHDPLSQPTEPAFTNLSVVPATSVCATSTMGQRSEDNNYISDCISPCIHCIISKSAARHHFDKSTLSKTESTQTERQVYFRPEMCDVSIQTEEASVRIVVLDNEVAAASGDISQCIPYTGIQHASLEQVKCHSISKNDIRDHILIQPASDENVNRKNSKWRIANFVQSADNAKKAAPPSASLTASGRCNQPQNSSLEPDSTPPSSSDEASHAQRSARGQNLNTSVSAAENVSPNFAPDAQNAQSQIPDPLALVSINLSLHQPLHSQSSCFSNPPCSAQAPNPGSSPLQNHYSTSCLVSSDNSPSPAKHNIVPSLAVLPQPNSNPVAPPILPSPQLQLNHVTVSSLILPLPQPQVNLVQVSASVFPQLQSNLTPVSTEILHSAQPQPDPGKNCVAPSAPPAPIHTHSDSRQSTVPAEDPTPPGSDPMSQSILSSPNRKNDKLTAYFSLMAQSVQLPKVQTKKTSNAVIVSLPQSSASPKRLKDQISGSVILCGGSVETPKLSDIECRTRVISVPGLSKLRSSFDITSPSSVGTPAIDDQNNRNESSEMGVTVLPENTSLKNDVELIENSEAQGSNYPEAWSGSQRVTETIFSAEDVLAIVSQKLSSFAEFQDPFANCATQCPLPTTWFWRRWRTKGHHNNNHHSTLKEMAAHDIKPTDHPLDINKCPMQNNTGTPGSANENHTSQHYAPIIPPKICVDIDTSRNNLELETGVPFQSTQISHINPSQPNVVPPQFALSPVRALDVPGPDLSSLHQTSKVGVVSEEQESHSGDHNITNPDSSKNFNDIISPKCLQSPSRFTSPERIKSPIGITSEKCIASPCSVISPKDNSEVPVDGLDLARRKTQKMYNRVIAAVESETTNARISNVEGFVQEKKNCIIDAVEETNDRNSGVLFRKPPYLSKKRKPGKHLLHTEKMLTVVEDEGIDIVRTAAIRRKNEKRGKETTNKKLRLDSTQEQGSTTKSQGGNEQRLDFNKQASKRLSRRSIVASLRAAFDVNLQCETSSIENRNISSNNEDQNTRSSLCRNIDDPHDNHTISRLLEPAGYTDLQRMDKNDNVLAPRGSSDEPCSFSSNGRVSMSDPLLSGTTHHGSRLSVTVGHAVVNQFGGFWSSGDCLTLPTPKNSLPSHQPPQIVFEADEEEIEMQESISTAPVDKKGKRVICGGVESSGRDRVMISESNNARTACMKAGRIGCDDQRMISQDLSQNTGALSQVERLFNTNLTQRLTRISSDMFTGDIETFIESCFLNKLKTIRTTLPADRVS